MTDETEGTLHTLLHVRPPADVIAAGAADAALVGNTLDERQLAALESRTALPAGAGLLALVPAARGIAVARRVPPADATAPPAGSVGRPEITQPDHAPPLPQ